ncbi:MAG: glycosyltransferase family 2 protein [Candidatus Paceibacterota bacterium]|jgi:glycosyltransferase involved in cell wall biosynthesis
MKLSVIIPVYNEAATILESIRGVEGVSLPYSATKEIIIVDDGSSDATPELLKSFKGKYEVITHEKNRGKGRAIRTALSHATGDYIVTHDGDLENDPNDLARMLTVMVEGNHTALYGSRRLGHHRTEGTRLSFYAGGVLLSFVASVLYGQNITDEPTCYKMFRGEFLKSLPLSCERFEYCPEVTALTALRGITIAEVPISYRPRDIAHGKKIRWYDGLEALKTLLKYRFKSDAAGRKPNV